ncbi:MAG: hypothetical protein ACLFVJ_16505 [Persicimonas sp.]
MMQTFKLLAFLWIAVLLTSCATTGATSESDSASVEREYAAALEGEQRRVSEPAPIASGEDVQEVQEAQEAEKLGVHMGLALGLGALNEVVKDQLQAELIGLIGGADGSFSIAGRQIPLGIDSDLVDLQISPDDACQTCLRVSGKLAGKVDFDLPLTRGASEDDYGSKFSLVAPLQFVRGADGGALLRFDTAQIVRLGGLFVETKIEGLPSKVQPLLRKGLDKAFSEELLSNLEPIDLVTVPTLPLGIDGLEVLPSALSLETETNTLFMGVATNLAGIDGDIDGMARLGTGDAAAVGVHLQVLAHALTLKMRNGEIARRYDLDGTANPEGSAHVVIRGLRAKPPSHPEAGSELVLDFEIFNFGASGRTFRAPLSAHIRLPNGDEGAYVDRVELSERDAAERGPSAVADWAYADLLDSALELVDQVTQTHGVDIASRNLFVGMHRVQVGTRSLTSFAGASDAP